MADFLPIDSIKSELLNALQQKKDNRPTPVIVTAETGAGKSTRIPLWLSEWYRKGLLFSTLTDHSTPEQQGVILVVEPRRVACQSLATYLSDCENLPVGARIGSRVRFADQTSDATEIIFATPGIALKMLADFRNNPILAVILDEFHERHVETDLILTILTSDDTYRNIPLLVTSATLDLQPLAQLLRAKTLHSPGRTYPVKTLYYEDFAPAELTPPSQPTLYDLDDHLLHAVRFAVDNLEGNILVFLPGYAQILSAQSVIKRCNFGLHIEIVHGSRPPELLRSILSERNTHTHRILYLSTNIAETSITIPNVNIVIDSGLAKTHLHQGGQSALATIPIANDSMLQRAGRAGRLRPGTALRLWSKRYQPDPYTTPEIARIELDDLLLNAALCGLQGERFDCAHWLTPPPSFAVERARHRLRSLDALNDKNELTTFGRTLGNFPTDTKYAALLAAAPTPIQPFFCDLIAILQVNGDLLRPLPTNTSTAYEVREARIELLCEITNAVDERIKVLNHATKRHAPTQRLYDAQRISNQLRQLLKLPTLNSPNAPLLDTSDKSIIAHILRTLPEHGFVRRQRAKISVKKSRQSASSWSNGISEVRVRDYVGWSDDRVPKLTDAAVIFDIRWQTSGTRVFAVSDLYLPCTYDDLNDANLGTTQVADVEIVHEKGDIIVVGNLTRTLSTTVISQQTTPLTGAELCVAVAQLIAENRIFKGVYERLLDLLHLWQVLLQVQNSSFAEELAGYIVAPLPTFQALSSPSPTPNDIAPHLLTQRLQQLGLSSSDDLPLIDDTDLLPHPGVGYTSPPIPDWILDPIAGDFPRTWEHLGSRYTVDVDLPLARITLRPANSSAKKAGEPNRRILPNFRGFAVFFEHASRRLRIR